MRIFFITTWPCESGLSQATVHPHLEQLAADERVDRIVYFSVEVTEPGRYVEPTAKVEHIPLLVRTQGVSLFAKTLAYSSIGRLIIQQALLHKPDLVICRGAPAGIYGCQLKRRFGVPYYVESFEPHADYMRYSGTWSQFGVKYLTQRRWEEKIKRTVDGLVTVSEAYAQQLVDVDGIPAHKVFTVPCWVDVNKFRFDSDERRAIRESLGIGNDLACVYVGKFGDLYHNIGVLESLQYVREGLGGRLFVMVLSNVDKVKVVSALVETGFPEKDFFVDFVPHGRVFAYLSAADFGVSFCKSLPCSYACSPIKHGEYLSCGLPFMTSTGVADEAGWIEEERAGAVVDFNSPDTLVAAASKIKAIVGEEGVRQRMRQVAGRRRGKEKMINVYDEIITTHQRGRYLN